jgi:ureidoglycolate dehydrogenase (NAD+)
MKDSTRIPAAQLSAFVVEVLAAVGVPRTDGTIVADCLLTANLSGVDSHGVVRLAHYVTRLQNGTIRAQPDLRFERCAPSMGIMDGGDGLGHVVTYHACTHAMLLAEESGSGIVSVRNSSHFGMTGFYILRLVSEGYAGMMMTATDAFQIPFGSRAPFFGTGHHLHPLRQDRHRPDGGTRDPAGLGVRRRGQANDRSERHRRHASHRRT